MSRRPTQAGVKAKANCKRKRRRSPSPASPATAAVLVQMQQATDEWIRWERRVLATYPEEDAESILDLHTHAINIHNGFGSVSHLCADIQVADRRCGGALSREAAIGIAPTKRLLDLEKAHPAARARLRSKHA